MRPIGVRAFPIPPSSSAAILLPRVLAAGRCRRLRSVPSQARIGAVPPAGLVQALVRLFVQLAFAIQLAGTRGPVLAGTRRASAPHAAHSGHPSCDRRGSASFGFQFSEPPDASRLHGRNGARHALRRRRPRAGTAMQAATGATGQRPIPTGPRGTPFRLYRLAGSASV